MFHNTEHSDPWALMFWKVAQRLNSLIKWMLLVGPICWVMFPLLPFWFFCKSSNLPENPPNNPKEKKSRIPILSDYFMVILIHFRHVGMDQYLLIPLVG